MLPRLRFGLMCQSVRSEEHTSELQSLTNLVCRLLLEKKKKKINKRTQQAIKAKSTSEAPRIRSAQTAGDLTHPKTRTTMTRSDAQADSTSSAQYERAT